MTKKSDRKLVPDEAAHGTRRDRSAESTPNYHICCPHCHERATVPEQAFFQEIQCPHCGSTFNLASAASTADRGAPPTHVGPYILLEQLGHGQYGSVWKARDTKLDRIVALKIPRRTNLSDAELEMFFREARAAAQLQHANIVTVHDVGRDGSCVFIANEFVQGANLREWLEHRRTTFREAVEICIALAMALEHAHQIGVIHRDLKPANIMMDLAGQPRIMDFGLARRETGEVTVTLEGQIVGTPAYMSPEQAMGEGHQADRRSDLFSLGVMLYEMLTGERPFRGERQMLTLQILSEDPQPPRRLNQRIPKDLETICLKCLEKKPERRYSTAAALAQDLDAWRDKRPIQARPVGRIGRVTRWCQRRPQVAGLLAAMVLVTLTAFALVSWQARVAGRQAKIAGYERDRAQEYLEKLLESVDQMLVEVGAQRLRDEPHMEETRRALIDEALAFYDWLSSQDSDSSTIRWLHAKALLQAGMLRRYLGDQDQRALESLRMAEDLITRELSLNPLDAELLVLQADLHLQLALVAEDEGRGDIAADQARRAIRSVELLPASIRQDYLPTLGDAQLILATHLRQKSELASAEKLLDKTIMLFDDEREHSTPRHMRVLIKAHHDLAILLSDRAGEHERAILHFQNALRLAESVKNSSVAHKQRLLSLLGDYASNLHLLDRDDDAEQLWLRSRDIQEQLIAEYPTVPEFHYGLAMYFQAHGYYGFFREFGKSSPQQDELDRLQGEVEEAIRILDDLATRYPRVGKYGSTMANSYNLLGNLLINRDHLAEAEVAYGHCADDLRQRLDDDPHNAALCHNYGGVLKNIGQVQYEQDHYTAALETVTRALEYQHAALASEPENVSFHVYHRNQVSLRAHCLWALGRWSEANDSLDDAVTEAQYVFDAMPSGDNRSFLVTACSIRARLIAGQSGLRLEEYEIAKEDIRRVRAIRVEGSDPLYWKAVDAAVGLRLGHPESLIAWSEEFDESEETREWFIIWAFAAVAHANAGNGEQARRYLERVEDSEIRSHWQDHVASMLIAEAQAALEKR